MTEIKNDVTISNEIHLPSMPSGRGNGYIITHMFDFVHEIMI